MKLSNINSDFSTIVQDIEANLDKRETFKALFPGETSKVITEFLAAVTSMMLYRIDTASQNSFMDTAISPLAIRTLDTMLGGRTRRKVGSKMTVTSSITSPIPNGAFIPRFTRFECRGLQWFTNSAVTVAPNASTVTLELTQGDVQTDISLATGLPFQIITMSIPDFQIEDISVRMTIS